MIYMGTAGDWVGGWPERGRRIAASPAAPAVAGSLLGLAAMTEAIARGAANGMSVARLAGVCTLVLFTTVPLAFLGPVAAAVAICAASVLSLAAFQMLTIAGLAAQLIVLYRLGRNGSSRRNEAPWDAALGPALAVPFLVLALAGTGRAGSEKGVLVVLLASLAPAVALAGIAQRARGEALVHSAARQAVAGTLLEHMARGERARIARELHDVVAHHISMIAVQAETARLATPGMPAAGAQRLSQIGDTARAGLTEMRRLLGVLREDAQAGQPGADRHPQPGLRQLNELVDEARDASGAAARLIVSGPPATLDPGVELAAYRIVQEALTNVRRHAPRAAVDVEVHYTEEGLRLRIRDNGPGPPGSAPVGAPETGGHGLAGMRERAAAAGGELRTGAAPGGGFLIEALLPAKVEVAP
jgi:signal transduction histidine kinase